MSRCRLMSCFCIVGMALMAGCGESKKKTIPPVLTKDNKKNDEKKILFAKKTNISFFAKPAFAQGMAKGGDITLSDIAEKAVKAVVNIRSTKRVAHQQHPFRGMPFFGPRDPHPHHARSLGSGVIITHDGIVITNHHVVRHADEILVSLNEDQEFRARLLGSDPKSDIAILRLENPPEKLPALRFGVSEKLRLGEVVLAIGNPFGVGKTVTMGIVSALGRANVGIVAYEDFIQTDAAINPGNSGGALVNMRGELVGINTAILSRSGGYQGIGFAIPSKMAKPIMESLLQHGRVIRGWLGVGIQSLNPQLAAAMGLSVVKGVVVTQIQPGSPADKGGLKRGDVITKMNGQPIRNGSRLRNIVAAHAGREIKIIRYRGHDEKEIVVRLGELPSEKIAKLAPNQGALGGLTVETISDQHRRENGLKRIKGVIVTAIASRSAAEAAGLQKGDIIIEINRHVIENTLQFSQIYRGAKGRLVLLVYRDGNLMYLLQDK